MIHSDKHRKREETEEAIIELVETVGATHRQDQMVTLAFLARFIIMAIGVVLAGQMMVGTWRMEISQGLVKRAMLSQLMNGIHVIEIMIIASMIAQHVPRMNVAIALKIVTMI
jgi:hypothetical protein